MSVVDYRKIEALEKGKLLKSALKIIDELAKNEEDVSEWDVEHINELIKSAKKLTKNKFWKLT